MLKNVNVHFVFARSTMSSFKGHSVNAFQDKLELELCWFLRRARRGGGGGGGQTGALRDEKPRNKVNNQHQTKSHTASTPGIESSVQSGSMHRDGAVVRALTSHQFGLGSIPGLGVICGLRRL